jgi:hypothetical protein
MERDPVLGEIAEDLGVVILVVSMVLLVWTLIAEWDLKRHGHHD